MKPIKILKNGTLVFSEDQEHLILAQYLTAKGILFHHSPNEMTVNTAQAKHWLMKRARIGVKKGFPDFIIFLPNCILFIEMKRADATPCKVSKEQKWWIDELNNLPYCKAMWCKGADHAIKEIEFIIKGG